MEETNSKIRLGDVLVVRGSLSQEELNRAVAMQSEQEPLGDVLSKDGLAAKSETADGIEQVRGVTYEECSRRQVAPEVLALVPHPIALRCCALPLEIKGRRELVVAMAEPQNLAALNELKFCAGMEIKPRIGFREDILSGIKRNYGDDGSLEQEGDEVNINGKDESASDLEFIAADSWEEDREVQRELRAGMRQKTPAVRCVSSILAAAAEKKASDIHIEPRVGNMIVRIRVDGILMELMTIPSKYQASVVSRVKILADMDIAERRVPQDGRFLMQYRDHRFDLRVSTMPTHFGEKVVIRVLDPRTTCITLDQLGFSDRHANDLTRLLAMPQGMMLVTGPTGAGKSTTLYAALNLLRSPRRNIITVEDPVEYLLEGVNQIQVHPKAGLTFASCLPKILRQDPDVIMVGEIRDGETAEIALKASQTGHLVLSTLHTNDSVAAIPRLMDLGVPAYLIASSVTGVVAQRLVRRLCSCRKKLRSTSIFLKNLEKLGVKDAESYENVYQPVGCDSCEGTGYRGRVGIYEMLLIEGQIRDAIHSNARGEEICELARAAGFRTMQEDSLEKVKSGLTTLEEVQRVVPFDSINADICQSCTREIMANFVYCPHCGSNRNNVEPLVVCGTR